EPEQIQGAKVSASMFRVLGVRPAIGRDFLPDEDDPGAGDVAVISHSLWLRRFGADPMIVGRPLILNGKSYAVVGVLAPGFQFLPGQLSAGSVDVFATKPFDISSFTPQQVEGGVGYLYGVARLKAGTSVRLAETDLAEVSRRYIEESPNRLDANPHAIIALVPVLDLVVQGVRTTLLLLFAAVAMVLLIACANVATLQLARGAARQREIAIRVALGAGRARIMRQLLTESVLIAILGGALGVFLASGSLGLLTRSGAAFIPRSGEVRIDWLVIAFSLGVSMLTGILFGLAPALRVSKVDLNESLKEGSRGSNAGRNRSLNLLVASEIALSLVLLIATGLMIRTFIRLQAVDPGFSPHNVLSMQIALPVAKYKEDHQKISFFDDLCSRVQALPGVQSASISISLPPFYYVAAPLLVEGYPFASLGERPVSPWTMVGPDYFKTMGIAQLKGRPFDRHDNERSLNVSIISESLARRFFADVDPIGKHITIGRMMVPSEIVGVVADVKNQGLAAPAEIQVYTPYPQRTWQSMNLVVRTVGDPASILPAVKSQILSLDKDQPVTNVQTMDEIVQGSISQPRFTMILLAIFAGIALVMAVAGIYGVMAYSVTHRTREIGIRMALGAGRGMVLRSVIREALVIVAVGIGVGATGAFAATHLMSTLLFGVGRTDPATYVAISAILAASALVACYIPARRATKVDPLIALRYE
ncbi:MAG TPA: ABC transporter permease, partial [Blastocatellia bacterium]|nr:ABC transporter permease [Blastocatellia bacterium]